MEFWGKIGQAKMKAKDENDKGRLDDELNAIWDSIVEEDAALKKAAVSEKNQPTESLSLSQVPSFPATTEFWGKILKGPAKMKAKDGVDDELNAIWDSIVEEDDALKKAAVSGKNRPTESLSLSKIPSFPATVEFWGVEVKPGQTVKCEIEEGKLLHLSQAALGESKKGVGVERVSIFVKFNDQTLVVGTLSQEKCAQIQYDLVFEKEFDLSHSSKNASVYFCGYKTASQNDSPSGEEDFSGKIVKKEQAKVKAKDENDKVGSIEMIRNMFRYKPNDEDDEATVSGKKRPIESASKTPATEKKAKLILPAGQKTGGNGRKGAHTATPHPAKTGKTPANNDKSKQQTPKSSGSATCKSCSKSFNSDNALQAHTKAKHSATK